MAPEGSIERLKKKLYSRSAPDADRERRPLYPKESGAATDWKQTLTAPVGKALSSAERSRHFRPARILAASVVFFIIATAFGAFFFLGGNNIISSRNLNIGISGPTTIGGGEELTLQVMVTNRNSIGVQLADLVVEYPDGTRTAGNLGKELLRYRESLGDIAPGQSIQKTIHAVLFGQERTQKDIKITVEYRVTDSNAIFYKETTYPITISSSPASLSISAPSEAVSGQSFSTTIEVVSNSVTPLNNVLVHADYPFGFSFTSATPKPTYGDNVWNLGTILPGDKRSIVLTGTLEGQDNEERIFRYQTGIQSDQNDRELKAAFVDVIQTIAVKRPFIGIDLALSGKTADPFVAAPGQLIRGDITWTNNLDVPIVGGEIVVHFSGAALNTGSITSDSGFYRSADTSLVWSRDNADLAEIAPGKTGHFSFEFAPTLLSGNVRNPQIKLEISARGNRVAEGNVPESVDASLSRTVKISSDLALVGTITRLTGPLPPKANQETTYRVQLAVRNTANQIGDARVVASLPAYVRYIGSSGNDAITYSQVGGTVTWQIGNIASGGAGTTATFDISFTPSVSQLNTVPLLVGEQSVSGIDRFTGTPVSATSPSLTTRITGGTSGQEVVQP